jgi:hypothetical protein
MPTPSNANKKKKKGCAEVMLIGHQMHHQSTPHFLFPPSRHVSSAERQTDQRMDGNILSQVGSED